MNDYVNVATGQVIRIPSIFKRSDYEYPSAWFKAEPNRKPLLTVPTVPEADYGKLVSGTIRALKDGSLSVNQAMAFVYMSFARNKQRLVKDWSSFGIKIGAAQDAIGIDSIMKVTVENNVTDISLGTYSESNTNKIVGLMIFICSINRTAGIEHASHKNTIWQRVAVLTSSSELGVDAQAISNQFMRFASNPNFVSLMAAVDMLLQEFPNHVFAQARVGTIASRFKDCGMLKAAREIMESLNLNEATFAKWIWNDNAAKDFERIFKDGEEIDNSRSYAMYFKDMGLSQRSPYSVSANPNLHFFCHAIGCSMNIERSRNAKMVGVVHYPSLYLNAMVIAYVTSKYGESSRNGIVLDGACEGNTFPEGRDPEIWKEFISKNNSEVPAAIKKRIAKVWDANRNCRENTVGRYLFQQSGVVSQL